MKLPREPMGYPRGKKCNAWVGLMATSRARIGLTLQARPKQLVALADNVDGVAGSSSSSGV